MRYSLTLLLFVLISINSYSQITVPSNQPASSADADSWKNKPFLDKVYVGGDAGLNFGNTFTSIMLSPFAGYRITPDWSVGVGVKYQWFKDHIFDYSDHLFGGSVFTRYLIGNYLIAHAEYEMLNVTNVSAFQTGNRAWAQMAFVGGGFRQGFNGTYVQILLLYDLINDRNSPYRFQYLSPDVPLIIRGGIVVNLSN